MKAIDRREVITFLCMIVIVFFCVFVFGALAGSEMIHGQENKTNHYNTSLSGLVADYVCSNGEAVTSIMYNRVETVEVNGFYITCDLLGQVVKNKDTGEYERSLIINMLTVYDKCNLHFGIIDYDCDDTVDSFSASTDGVPGTINVFDQNELYTMVLESLVGKMYYGNREINMDTAG